VDAVDLLSEYQDDNSEFHIRDALNNIVERSPFVVATPKAIEEHCFKGASSTGLTSALKLIDCTFTTRPSLSTTGNFPSQPRLYHFSSRISRSG
jgi:hypothetical protein